jgi:glycosyltransferase involved in cell wall biosynthesis
MFAPVTPNGSKLRVAQLIESDGPGGAESVLLALAEGLPHRQVDVLPVGLAGGEGWLSGRLRAAGHEPFLPPIHRTHRIDVALVWKLARWVRTQRIDVLHAHEWTMAVYAGAVGALTRTPHLITMHGGRYYASAWHRRQALRWSAQRADAVVGVAPSTCEHLASTLALPPSHVTLVPNGVPHRLGHRDVGRASLALHPNEKLLLAVGNLYTVKGHHTLVAAAERLRNDPSLPPWRIAIAGRGDEEAALRRQIHEAGLDDRVQLLGLRSDIPDLLAAADGWVMPSLSEGLPMALLEALMAGVPTVCSAVGGIPALIESGVSGWLVEPNDPADLCQALSVLLQNPTLAREVAARGQSMAVSAYGVDRMIDRYVTLYRDATERG